MAKAFVVSNYEDNSVIVFADTHNQARAHADLDDDYVDLRARRFPEMDGREKNPPTLRELFETQGWYVICNWCERAVFGEQLDQVWDDKHTYYCSAKCAEKRKASRLKIDTVA